MAAQILANTLIRIFVGLTVALGIASVLVVSVVQKSKEIGILRAMGTARAQVLRVFLHPGRLHGAHGRAVRVAARLGLPAPVARRRHGTPTARRCSSSCIEPSLFAIACVGATLVGILAAVVPARRAARLDPGGGDPWLMRARAETLRLAGVRKSYGVGTPVEVEVLHGIDLALRRGEFAALIGPSGSGKTTLLNLIGLLDRPSAGRIVVAGAGGRRARRGRRPTRLRGRAIGFIFQYHHLLPAFTALENVMMPMLAARGRVDAEMRETAASLLDRVGLTPLARPQGIRHLRRAAAARRDRPRARDEPGAGARRRAERQPRHRKRRRGLRPDARGQRGERHDVPDRHPRPAPRAALRPHRRARRRDASSAIDRSPNCGRGTPRRTGSRGAPGSDQSPRTDGARRVGVPQPAGAASKSFQGRSNSSTSAAAAPSERHGGLVALSFAASPAASAVPFDAATLPRATCT